MVLQPYIFLHMAILESFATTKTPKMVMFFAQLSLIIVHYKFMHVH